MSQRAVSSLVACDILLGQVVVSPNSGRNAPVSWLKELFGHMVRVTAQKQPKCIVTKPVFLSKCSFFKARLH